MNSEYNFTIINKEGIEVICDVISIISDDESRIYLLYTDYLLDNDGNFRLLASELVQSQNDFILKEIEDKDKLKELLRSANKVYTKKMSEIME